MSDNDSYLHELIKLNAEAQCASLRLIGECALTGGFAQTCERFDDLARRAMLATQILEEMAEAEATGNETFFDSCRLEALSQLKELSAQTKETGPTEPVSNSVSELSKRS